jgi:hypothetical protein
MSNATKQDLLNKMSGLHACAEATKWVAAQKGNAQDIWGRCERGDWMLWLAARISADKKLIITSACLCARTALQYVPASEERPLKCIETVERWVRGEATLDEVRQARENAYAAYDASNNAASAAVATAATYAATYAATAADAAANAASAAANAAANATCHAAASTAATAATYASNATAYAASKKTALKQCADIIRTVIAEVHV